LRSPARPGIGAGIGSRTAVCATAAPVNCPIDDGPNCPTKVYTVPGRPNSKSFDFFPSAPGVFQKFVPAPVLLERLGAKLRRHPTDLRKGRLAAVDGVDTRSLASLPGFLPGRNLKCVHPPMTDSGTARPRARVHQTFAAGRCLRFPHSHTATVPRSFSAIARAILFGQKPRCRNRRRVPLRETRSVPAPSGRMRGRRYLSIRLIRRVGHEWFLPNSRIGLTSRTRKVADKLPGSCERHISSKETWGRPMAAGHATTRESPPSSSLNTQGQPPRAVP
jgi:hypothetical protein